MGLDAAADEQVHVRWVVGAAQGADVGHQPDDGAAAGAGVQQFGEHPDLAGGAVVHLGAVEDGEDDVGGTDLLGVGVGHLGRGEGAVEEVFVGDEHLDVQVT